MPCLLPSPDIRHNPRYVCVFQRGCAKAITQAALPTARIDLFKRRVLSTWQLISFNQGDIPEQQIQRRLLPLLLSITLLIERHRRCCHRSAGSGTVATAAFTDVKDAVTTTVQNFILLN